MKTYNGSLTLEVFSKDQENELPQAFMASAYQSIQRVHTLLLGED
jgi:hypothetical protein